MALAFPKPTKRVKQRKRLRRSGRLRAISTSRYRTRPRDLSRMRWIRTQPCAAAGLGDHCNGPIEAHHAGERGMSRKAPDDTCIALCRRHHREPGLHVVPALADRVVRRAWVREQVEAHRGAWLVEQAQRAAA